MGIAGYLYIAPLFSGLKNFNKQWNWQNLLGNLWLEVYKCRKIVHFGRLNRFL